MATYKLGKLPASNSVKLKFTDFSKLPSVPTSYGHYQLVSEWGLLGNDQYGDCVWAGAGHETMLWNAEARKTVNITTQDVLMAYSAVTGFNKNDPSTDQGTNMGDAAKYRQKTGIQDGMGNWHKIGAYTALGVGNAQEVKEGIYLFGSVGLGVLVPEFAQQQFNEGKPWSVVPGAQIEGGHYVPAVGYDQDYLYVVTWGKVQPVEWDWYEKYNDEGLVYISEEFLSDGLSMEGFNLTQLTEDLRSL